ncbi:MAG: transcription-repair coupling factor [Defluviitaleaceae bacterium]|nr:transcription-repair coupling factor [Defluviitaleaceae bacterium]
MQAIFSFLNLVDSYNQVALPNFLGLKSNEEPEDATLITGLVGSQKWHLAAALMQQQNRPGLIVTYSEISAKAAFDDMQYFSAQNCLLYPARDLLYYAADVKSADVSRKRFSVLAAILACLPNGQACPSSLSAERASNNPVIVLSAEVLLERIISKQELADSIITLTVGERYSTDNLLATLAKMGYVRTYQVEGAGQFAVRGGIIDICTMLEEEPAIRLEFFDDELDSIRTLDVISQRSGNSIKTAKIFPIADFSAEYSTNLLDYLPKDTILFFDEPNFIETHIKTVWSEYEENIKSQLLKTAQLPQNIMLTFAEAKQLAKAFDIVMLADMTMQTSSFNHKPPLHFTVKSCPPLRQNPAELKEDISYWLNQNYSIVLLTAHEKNCQHLADSLTDMEIPARYDEHLREIPPKTVTVTGGTLSTGFEYPECKLVVITDKEMFPQFNKSRKRRRRSKLGSKIDNFTDLVIGDHIVHYSHGVGIFAGIEQVVIDGLSRDYLKIKYADGELKVHTGQMDQLQKYIGNAANLRLNKLSGTEWAKSKLRVKGAVKILASDLVALYAKRQASKGFVYSKDTVWQSDFEMDFPYEETDDQIAAIDDIKMDMESERIMDRLLCGDVGYGKTEVAVRAAFKAIQDSKQVAYLVPTTILAQQHYITFVNRMKNYPVTIERLSRFQTAKEQKTALKRITSGEADIVIGTHRLLSKDVQFKELGLIIVDEEQRFGVSHKEKLKNIKADVDVLTLTATPIPRTLHLSMTGLRDMSILNEPPSERRPVQTYVMEYNKDFIREAINRELSRNGQVYYLHNRVRNIVEETAKLQAIVPYAEVAFAHGQMSERELENIMLDFINGEIDVLVCTTIIETGLDIPNVNTLIVQNADYMGLSQLYQLRGRVGRSNRLAYAYLMYRKDKILDEIAQRRLQTIRDFTEFGAGFKIALRDLEIRGAGNLLGAEQHGHMDSVGYEMYCKLLEEAVQELQGNQPLPTFETSVDIAINAYIPTYYIEDEMQKLEIYKKIAMIRTQQDSNDMQEEIEDRFGDLPKTVQNLLDVALLKEKANQIGITAIKEKANQLIIIFKHDATVDFDKLTTFIMQESDQATFKMLSNPRLTYKIKQNSKESLAYILGKLAT